MPGRCLLLNASFEPHSIISDQEAVVLYLEDLIEVVEYSGEAFHSPSTTVLVPSIARLKRYVVLPERHRSVMLTTRNVCARDEYVCAYCGRHADTMDHIVPRAHGGPHTWENVTAACRRCNHKKGDRMLSELGWKLDRKPVRPHGVGAYLLSLKPEPAWRPYLAMA